VNPRAPFAVFDRNHGRNRTTVFDGELRVASAPPATGAPAPWSEPHALRFSLQTPFRDGGGHLCLEFIVNAVSGKLAPDDFVIDAEQFLVRASTSILGRLCSAGGLRIHAGVGTAGLRPGATGTFHLFAPRNKLCLHALGASSAHFGSIPLPFDLTAAGAPGCAIYNDWLFTTEGDIETHLFPVLRLVASGG
jgi:hypothetical protein